MGNYRLFWIPRGLTIIFILFLTLFALDAFSGEATFIQKLGGFFIHLIPSFILFVSLAIAWIKPLAGGIVLILLGLAFTFYFGTCQFLLYFLALSCPPILAGTLFIVFYFYSA